MTYFDHDYKQFPELRIAEREVFQFSSPHKQITEDFDAQVIRVHDGDTITLRTSFRDFDFPLRFLDINSPELSEPKGEESKVWLSSLILDKMVHIKVDPRKIVGKYGRLLGVVFYNGINVNETMVMLGYAKQFQHKDEGKIPNLIKVFREGAIA